MSVYMTEEEQLAAIKKWWKDHQNWITLILTIVFFLVAGYRYWNWHMEKTILLSSSTYENMMSSIENHDDKSTQSYANQLIKDSENSVYAIVAHLTLAKIGVSHHDWAKAEKELAYVVAHSKVPSLKQIALIRSARLLASQHQYDKALSTLSTLDKTSDFIFIANELKGDIYWTKKDYAKAMESYQSAINEMPKNTKVSHFLEMKMAEMRTMVS